MAKCDFILDESQPKEWPNYRCSVCGFVVEVHYLDQETIDSRLESLPPCGQIAAARDVRLKEFRERMKQPYDTKKIRAWTGHLHETMGRRLSICLSCENWDKELSGCLLSNPPELRNQRIRTRIQWAPTCFATCLDMEDRWKEPTT